MNKRQYEFVTEYLRHKDKIVAYNIAYGYKGRSYDTIESAANRLLRIPEIAETINRTLYAMRTEVEAEIRAEFREELLPIYDKRLILKKVATGDIQVEQKYKGKNCTQCSQHLGSTVKERLSAIKDDNKLAGHYPYKENGKWVIPARHEAPKEIPQSPPPDWQKINIEQATDNNFTEPPSTVSDPSFCEECREEEYNGHELLPDETFPSEEFETEKNLFQTTNRSRSLSGEFVEANKKTLIIETKDNKLEEVRIDNQSVAISQKIQNTPTVNSSGRIIPGNIHQQPSFHDLSKLTPMKNGS